VGVALADAVGSVLGSEPVQRFPDTTTFGLSTAMGRYLASCTQAGGACSGLQLDQLGQNPNLIFPYLLTHVVRPAGVVVALVALVVLALGIQLVGKLVAMPAPFVYRGASPEATSTRSIVVVAGLALLSTFVGLVVFLRVLGNQAIDLSDP